MIYLDTHVAVWLYAGELDRFSKAALRDIEEHDLMISPVVLLEIQYLREIKRLRTDAHVIADTLARSISLQVCDLAFDQVVLEALSLSWTRDPFDRIIVAQATARNAALLTKDESILAHYKKAFWDK